MCTTTPAGALSGRHTAAALPPEFALRDAASPRVMGHPQDADRDGGSGRSWICVQRRKQGRRLQERCLYSQGSDDRAFSASVPLSPLLPGRDPAPITPHATPSPTAISRPARAAPRGARHLGSNPSPSITRAPPSPQAQDATRSTARVRRFHPLLRKPPPRATRPAGRPSQPGFPASCAATAARDPPRRGFR